MGVVFLEPQSVDLSISEPICVPARSEGWSVWLSEDIKCLVFTRKWKLLFFAKKWVLWGPEVLSFPGPWFTLYTWLEQTSGWVQRVQISPKLQLLKACCANDGSLYPWIPYPVLVNFRWCLYPSSSPLLLCATRLNSLEFRRNHAHLLAASVRLRMSVKRPKNITLEGQEGMLWDLWFHLNMGVPEQNPMDTIVATYWMWDFTWNQLV